MFPQDSESENSCENSSYNQINDAIKNNFPFDSSSTSDCYFKGNNQNIEDQNIHFKSTNTFTSKSENIQPLEINRQEIQSIDCLELKEEKKNDNNSESSKKLQKKRKKSSDSKNKKNKKLNNWRKKIARNFFNKYLKKIIEKMAKIRKCIISFENFPDKFIFNVIKTKNKAILEMTLEKLIKNEDLYKDSKSQKYYLKNLEVLKKIQSNVNKVNTEEFDIDQTLNMKFKDLYKNYLQSVEYEQKKINLYKVKGISQGKIFEEMSENFIECYKY